MKQEKQNNYIIVVYNTEKNIYYILHKDFNINNIAYEDVFTIPGTRTIDLAKIYTNIDEAKSDIFKLKYYKKEFLKNVKFIITDINNLNNLAQLQETLKING